MAVTLPCPAEHWPLFSRLLDEALAVPEDGREAWLAALDGDGATLRPWLTRVLSPGSGGTTGLFLDKPTLPDIGGLEAGAVVGPFRLVRRLGEGGMGEVWLADRVEDGPQRQIALKLPHAFLLGAQARARFQRERDVLASLTHPNIAQLYEAGVSAENLPYLAIEYVDGTPITAWCRERVLPLDRRLALAQKILDALGYAHRRLIVHRDIKPSNVLVTAEGEVKLLDFGIAKLLGDSSAAGDLTQPASRLATPDYAAPEQLRGEEVTVSADLYAVGALVFELVTGVRPFLAAWRSPDEEAPLASSRADPDAARAPLGPRLARALRGDLDAILATALAQDPARRYPSADAFARDLAGFRAGLPVSARRVGWLTRVGKLARRQRLATALAAAFVLALAAGVGGVVWQAARAERAAARANLVKDFLIGVFQANDPRAPRDKPPGEVTAKEMLDAAAGRLDSGFAGDPESEMDVLRALGAVYEFMEDVPRAESLQARRVDLARRLYGPDGRVTLADQLDQAWDDDGFDDYDKAKAVLADSRDRILTVFGAHSHERGLWLMERAFALSATPETREERRRDSEEASRIFALERPVADDFPAAQSSLARVEMDSNRFAEALRIIESGAAADRAGGEFDPIEEMIYNVHSAQALENLGRPDEAERRLRLAAATADRTLGRRSSAHFQALSYLGDLLRKRGRRDEADRVFRQIEAEVDKADAPPGEAMLVREIYGAALAGEGRAAEALPVLRNALQAASARPHIVNDLPLVQQALGEAEDQLGRRDRAGPLLVAARAAWIREGPADAPWVLAARERWARFQMAGGGTAAALAEARDIVATAGGKPSAALALAQADLARLALRRNDVGEALEASAAALKTLGAAPELYDVRGWIPVWRARAQALAAAGRAAGAQALIKRAADAARLWGAP